MGPYKEARDLADTEAMKNGLPLRVGIVGDECPRHIDGYDLFSDLETPRQSLAIHGMAKHNATVSSNILGIFGAAVLLEIRRSGAQD